MIKVEDVKQGTKLKNKHREIEIAYVCTGDIYYFFSGNNGNYISFNGLRKLRFELIKED